MVSVILEHLDRPASAATLAQCSKAWYERVRSHARSLCPIPEATWSMQLLFAYPQALLCDEDWKQMCKNTPFVSCGRGHLAPRLRYGSDLV